MPRGPTGDVFRVVQIHPTRRCNLTCAHCYSSSGPEERGELSVALLRRALADAAAEGYAVASFSGGEPTLYRGLTELLEDAQQLGLLTTITSNGMLLTARLMRELSPHLDLLAISLDGRPESHDRMRGSELAFAKMNQHLKHVRDSGVPFGFIFTLTQRNLDELEWVADYAVSAGASLLQVHPLEEVGRAATRLIGERPDAIERAVANFAVHELQDRVGDRLRVQLDIFDLRVLDTHPAAVYADNDEPDQAARLADLVSPLVIEADGLVVPLKYGFARRFALGNLHNRTLHELALDWRDRSLDEFKALCRDTLASMNTRADTGRFANWYEEIDLFAETALADPTR